MSPARRTAPKGPVLSTAIVPGARAHVLPPRAVAREFRALLDAGAALCVAGNAQADPRRLLARHGPRTRIDLFDTRFYLSGLLQNPELRFFVAYVQPLDARPARVHARIFYKDVSLIWRSASHVIRSEHENWIGKGDVAVVTRGGYDHLHSVEESTDLPYEIQDALEDVSRTQARVPHGYAVVADVLRNGPDDRIRPYREWSAPRALAAANPRNRVNGGRRIARFRRPGDPESLVFAPGFAPDFATGVIEHSRTVSRLYGGEVRRFRILSANRRVQYLFCAGPRQAWIIPPQTLTTALTSFGVRSIMVYVDDDLCVPGYEYHYLDDTVSPPEMVSQIPAGYAGATSAVDPARADASAWIEALPVIQAFRTQILARYR